MAFLVSPGVQVKEVDLTNVVPAVATSIGAIAGAFQKGPVSSVTTITSEEDLIKNFEIKIFPCTFCTGSRESFYCFTRYI